MIIKQWPVSRYLLVALLLACAPCLAAQAEAADEPIQDQTFQLTQITAKDAATPLRTIVGTKDFRVVDERTVVVGDTAENLALAAAVVRMADSSDAPTAEERLAASDGTVITCVTLENARAIDVMDALRTQLRIARIATLGEKKIFLRDTDDQITAALKVISELESPASH